MTTRPTASTAALVLFICFACNMLGRGVGDAFMVFVLPLSEEFGWRRAQVSSVYSVYLLVNGLGAPLTGMLIDRWGPRVVYPLGLVLLGCACLLAAHLSEIWQFQLCIGMLAGMGTSMLGMVPASMLISRWFRDRMSTAMGVAYAGFGTGTIVIVPLAQRSIELQGWRDTYELMGIVLFAVLPLMLMLPWKRIAAKANPHPGPLPGGKPSPDPHPGPLLFDSGPGGDPGERESRYVLLKKAFRTREYWQLVTLFSFTSLTTFAVITQVVPMLVQSGLTPLQAATAFGTAGLLSVFGIPVAGWAGDRIGFRSTVTTTFVFTTLGIVGLLVFTWFPAPWLVLAYIFCFGTMQGARGPIVSSLAARHFAGPGFATIYGTMFAWMSVAGAVGGLVSGLLYDLTGGYRAGLVFAMAGVLVGVSPFWVSRPLGRP